MPNPDRVTSVTRALFGEIFDWATWDSAGAMSAIVQGALADHFLATSCKTQVHVVGEVEHYADGLRGVPVSLALWSIPPMMDLSLCCRSLAQVRQLRCRPVCLCYLESGTRLDIELLLQAGAHAVVHELTSLRRLLLNLLTREAEHAGEASSIGPRTGRRGAHPLTNGLFERLPWSDI